MREIWLMVGLVAVSLLSIQSVVYSYRRVATLELQLQLLVAKLDAPTAKVEPPKAQHTGRQDDTSPYLMDETRVMVPRLIDSKGKDRVLSFEERLRYLELKANTRFSWVPNPYFGLSKAGRKRECKKQSNLSELPSGCSKGKNQCPGSYDHPICLDELPPLGGGSSVCTVLDFGIRENPEFGRVLAKDLKCQVYAFDPSPISQKWFPSSDVAKLPNYKYFKFGAGAVDGTIQLQDYDWGQVSILRSPLYKGRATAKPHHLQVKQLLTILRDLDLVAKYVDVLKIDVEGSEFLFLQQAFDTMGCWPRFFGQITLEWHHYPWDVVYGGGASPVVNSLVALMEACDHELFHLHSEGWETSVKEFAEAGHHDVRYTLAGFRRKY
jgi:hypothetical protein